MTDEVLDRRSTIEAAFDAAEKADTPAPEAKEATPQVPTEQNEKAPDPSPTEIPEKPAEKPIETPAPTETPENPAEKAFSIDKAPQSWRGPQKAKWDSLDPDVRQEVMRRERDITRVMGETGQARQIAQKFQQAIQPFTEYMQSRNLDPFNAFGGLMKADQILSTATPDVKAKFMAQLIQDYKIDIEQLDTALAGSGAGKVDPATSRLEALLEQRLAPIHQFLTFQQQQAQQAQQQEEQQVLHTIETMRNDPKYEHFEDVREDMADIIDLQRKKGVYLSLEQAYTRAIAMNPEISQAVATKQANASRTAAAIAANASAQKAKAASKSVGGAPNGLSSGPSGKLDRRATIEAAFDAAEGR